MADNDPRYLAMSPRDRATFDALLGRSPGGGERYDPHKVKRGGERITGDYYRKMREYYTGEPDFYSRQPSQRVEVRRWKAELGPPRVFALGPGHIPKAICQTSSC